MLMNVYLMVKRFITGLPPYKHTSYG